MSHVDAEDKPSGQPESPISTKVMSDAEEKPQVGSAEQLSGEPETPAKAADTEKSPVGITEKSYGGGKPQEIATDKSTDNSDEGSSTDLSSGNKEPHASSTQESSGNEKPHANSTQESSGKEKPHVNTADTSVGEAAAQVGTTGKAGQPHSQTDTTHYSSGEPQLQLGTANKISANDNSHLNATGDYSDEAQSSASAIDQLLGEENIYGSITVKSSAMENSQTSTDKSSTEKLQDIVSDRSSGEPQSPTSTPDDSSGGDISQDSPPKKSSEAGVSQESPIEKSSKASQVNTSVKSFEAGMLQESHKEKIPKVVELEESHQEKSPKVEELKESHQEKIPKVVELEESHQEKSPKVEELKESHQEKSPKVEELKESHQEKSPKVEELKESHQEKSPKVEELHESPTEESYVSEVSKRSPPGKVTDKPELQDFPTTKQEPQKIDAPQIKRRLLTSSGSRSPPRSDPPESLSFTTEESAHLKPPSDADIEERRTAKNVWWKAGGCIVLVLVVASVYSLLTQKDRPVHRDNALEIFFKEFANLKKDFPGQNEGLWFRSEKLLQKHLNTSDPSTPSIIILTAARDGEKTLLCVSKRLAKAYADARRAEWVLVYGPDESDSDSATSKMRIDEKLSAGFQSNSRAAVLYRLETLPSGSLLILYKYCDHENAAFKNVALVLTVLLEEQSLETDLSFPEVEEKVKDFLWERFASSEVSAHNEMDVDKLSGVWSRISHVVLPVFPVESVESGTCPGIED